jgi:hypothetical protein
MFIPAGNPEKKNDGSLMGCSLENHRTMVYFQPSFGYRPQTVGFLYPPVMTNSLLLKMAIEKVSFPITNGDFP